MNAPSSTTRPEPGAWFVTTHWSVVLSAQDNSSAAASAALETLCQTYWYPLYGYARRCGHSPTDAEDLTQGFFAQLLSKDYLKAAAREKGKFRTFLLTALKRFMANEWDRQHARKRGGFAQIVPIDEELAESRFASEGSHNVPPDILFDRHWAGTLLQRTLGQLEQEYQATGRARLFGLLRSCLARDDSALSYTEIAVRTNLTEAAVKMAVYRMRGRYREILREEIAQTVSSPGEVEEELQHLFDAFGP